MLIERNIVTRIRKTIAGAPRVVILYGPRQAGKTTLLRELFKPAPERVVFFNGDDFRTQDLLGQPNLRALKTAVGSHRIVCIDEAQRIPNIGLSLKLLFDALKLRIIASGSSSLELSSQVHEPLTGRATIFQLYPVALGELTATLPDTSMTPQLETFLRFGMYPKVLTTDGEDEKQQYLNDLVNTYLYKDILMFEQVRKPRKVIDLLSLLALQIGAQVSITELGKRLALSRPVVEKYLDILEKMFVIVNVRGFSRNLRSEIYKTSKYFFMDLGVRNALIHNFNPLNLRSDCGALFENFCIIERIKAVSNAGAFANFHFWRTYEQKEIDFIEERRGTLAGYECKWSERKHAGTAFKTFAAAYPRSVLRVVRPNNLALLTTVDGT